MSPFKSPLHQLFPEVYAERGSGSCTGCHQQVRGEDFKDELSRKEYKISGLCQACQDEVFTEQEE